MIEEIKPPISSNPEKFKNLVQEKDPEALLLLEKFSKAAVAGDKDAQKMIDYLEKKTRANLTNSTAQKIWDLLNDSHKQDFEKAETIEKVLEIIDQQIRQHQNVIGLFEKTISVPQTTGDEKKDATNQMIYSKMTPAKIENQKKRIKIEQANIDLLNELLLEVAPPPTT